jgi:gluconokinase
MTDHRRPLPPIVMMGVSASGKTAVGQPLAARLHCPFIDGDALHPQANIAKMSAGHPLNDTDRAPWLVRVGAWLAAHDDGGVIACSALKRRYRDRLRRTAPETLFVLLDPSLDVLRARDAARTGHFMPASLLDSQLATLERPDPDEHAIVITNDGSIREAVDAVIAALKERGIET